MARFIPTIDPSKIGNSSERKVANAFAGQLPDQVAVIHSLNWVRKRDSGPLVEGECDFVVIHPQFGLLFLEVKGGILEFDPSTEQWWRRISSNRKDLLNKDPFKQVHDNMYAIVEYITSHLKLQSLHCTYGYAAVFPDGTFQGDVPPSITRKQIIDANDLDRLEKCLTSIFRLFQRKNSKGLTREEVKRIKYALFPKFDIVPVLWREVEEQEQRLHRLTEEQKSLLDFLSNQAAASIQGGAGTGKTLLALAKAQQAAQAGMRTLLLCYNRPLREWLNLTAKSEFKHELQIKTYHELVHDYCKEAQLEFSPDNTRSDPKFWNERAPDLLMHACELLPDSARFDAVIVDEGQDFRELWWHSLESIFFDSNSKNCYYVFFDPNQILYLTEDLLLPSELGTPFVLQKNCRNSPHIAEYCQMLIDSESGCKNHSLDVFQVSSREMGFQKVSELVSLLSGSGSGGLKPSQIAVLVPGYPVDDWPAKFKRTAAVRDLEAWRNCEGILIESHARFKGLEADAVIMLTAPISNANDRDRRLNYVACSRAKHILKIVEVIEKPNDS